MILVVGRPALDEDGGVGGIAGRVALAAAAAGGRVELVGTIGGDAAGDELVLALGRAGIGHAALLRDAGAVTPGRGPAGDRLPRLDAGDVELGLGYLPECGVLLLAEPLAADARAVAATAAAYHGAPLVVVTGPDDGPLDDLPASATQLAGPADDDGAFAELVGRYAAALDDGRPATDAWQDALAGSGWEASAG